LNRQGQRPVAIGGHAKKNGTYIFQNKTPEKKARKLPFEDFSLFASEQIAAIQKL